MDSRGRGEAEAETVPVRVAHRLLLHEVRGLGWELLWIGSGIWLQAAICAERFVVDLAEAMERRSLEPETISARRWHNWITSRLWRRPVSVVRRCEPATTAWQHLATRIDMALFRRSSLTGRRDVSACC